MSLPPESVNVGVAGYQQWIEYAHYVRFEAPTDVCLDFAAKLLPGQRLQQADVEDIGRNAKPLRSGVLQNFNWFDLAKATNVVTAGGGSGQPQVWVDRDRGVFYFRQTD